MKNTLEIIIRKGKGDFIVDNKIVTKETIGTSMLATINNYTFLPEYNKKELVELYKNNQLNLKNILKIITIDFSDFGINPESDIELKINIEGE